MSIMRMRTLISGVLQARPILTKFCSPQKIVKRRSSNEFPLPFDNMPFRVQNRFKCTLFFAIVYGLGLWAPFIIVWYMMAKRTL